MCGETMQLREREMIDRVPGITQTKTSKFREWVCPECDYFEEAERREKLAGAERQQQFFAQAFVDLVDIERGLALVAQHFENRGTSFFRHFHA